MRDTVSDTISVEIPVSENFRALLACIRSNTQVSLVNRLGSKNHSEIYSEVQKLSAYKLSAFCKNFPDLAKTFRIFLKSVFGLGSKTFRTFFFPSQSQKLSLFSNRESHKVRLEITNFAVSRYSTK